MKFNTKKWIGIALMILLIYILPGVVSPWASLTENGVTVFFVLLGFIVGMLTMDDLIMPTIFTLGGLALYQVATVNEIFAGYFGSSIVAQLFFLFAICYLIQRDGTGVTLMNWACSIKAFRKSPLLLMFSIQLVFALVSGIAGVYGTLIIMFSLLKNICDLIDVPPSSKYGQFLYVGSFISANIGSGLTAGMYPMNQAFVDLFAGPAGVTLNVASLSLIALILSILWAAAFSIVMKYIVKFDMSKLVNIDMSKVVGHAPTKLTKKQALPLIAFGIIAIYAFTSSFWPSVGIIGAIKGLGVSLVTAIVFVVLSLITIDGEEVYKPSETLKNVSWGLVFGIGALIYIATQFSNSALGIVPWISSILAPLFANMNIFALIFFTVCVAFIVTNFIANTAAAYLLAALLAPVVAAFGTSAFNIVVFPAALIIACNVSFLTPAASGQAAILFGQKVVSMKFLWGRGLLLSLLWVIVCAGTLCIYVVL